MGENCWGWGRNSPVHGENAENRALRARGIYLIKKGASARIPRKFDSTFSLRVVARARRWDTLLRTEIRAEEDTRFSGAGPHPRGLPIFPKVSLGSLWRAKNGRCTRCRERELI